MDYGKSLAFTGPGVVILGVQFGSAALVGLAVLLIGVGALIVRLGYRRKKNITQR